MIALDTNVLLRYLVQDGGRQAELATELIESQLSTTNRGFVSVAVICELAWALRTTYRQSRTTIVGAIELLLKAGQIEVEAHEAVERGLAATPADIADGIIHFVGRAHGCAKTMTFDRRYARLAGVELLA